MQLFFLEVNETSYTFEIFILVCWIFFLYIYLFLYLIQNLHSCLPNLLPFYTNLANDSSQ